MSFKLGLTKADLGKATGGGSSFISTSGIYDVTILAVVVDQNEHGRTSLGFYVDLGNDAKQMLYSALPFANWDNTKQYDGNKAIFGTLYAILGIDPEDDVESIEASLPIGKGGSAKDVIILDGFEDIEVSMWVKAEYYRKKDDTIGENRVVRGFFRQEDKASGDEIVNGTEAGIKYSKQEKYFTDVSYGDDVTEADVKAMIDARKGGTDAPKPEAPPQAKRSKFAK
jgi:hypothetical protein